MCTKVLYNQSNQFNFRIMNVSYFLDKLSQFNLSLSFGDFYRAESCQRFISEKDVTNL